MDNQKGFAVVEFVDEGSIEVVPSRWIDRGNQMCAYPTGPTGNSLRKRVDSLPLSSWPTYKIKLRGSCNTFKGANKKADKLLLTSNVESSEDSAEEAAFVRKRKSRNIYDPSHEIPKKIKIERNKRRSSEATSSHLKPLTRPSTLTPIYQATIKPPPSKVESSHESGDSDRDSAVLATVDRSVISALTSSPSDSDIGSEPEATLPSVFEAATPVSRFQVHETTTRPETETAPIRTDDSDFNSCFQRFQEKVFAEFHDIKTELNVIRCNTYRKSNGSCQCPVNIPIANKDDLDRAESLLKEKTIQVRFENWAAVVGGTDYKSHARRVLNLVFTHALSRQVNFTGRNKKISFENKILSNCITSSVVDSHPVSRHDVEKVISNWFRGSKDHNGGREQRRK